MVGSLAGASEFFMILLSILTITSPILDIEAEGKGLDITTSKQTNTQANKKASGEREGGGD